MDHVYATLLLNETDSEINERNLTAVLDAAGADVGESRVKATVAAFEDVELSSPDLPERQAAETTTPVAATGDTASADLADGPLDGDGTQFENGDGDGAPFDDDDDPPLGDGDDSAGPDDGDPPLGDGDDRSDDDSADPPLGDDDPTGPEPRD